MKKVTKQSKAADAAEQWRQNYQNCSRGKWYSEDKRLIYGALIGLGDNPSPEAVNEVVGNTSWTDIRCDNCNEKVDTVIRLSGWGYGDHNDEQVEFCQTCVDTMHRLIHDE